MYLFSVIVPHYNSVNFIKKLLKTIPIAEDIQLIVVDDKSQEDIYDLEKMVASRGGTLIHNTTERKGAGICRNIGLKEATGKWLIFADADDFFLQHAFDIFRKYAERDADIVYFSPISIYADTEKMAERHIFYEKLIKSYMQNSCEHNETALRYKFVSPWSKMIRNKMVKINGIYFDDTIAANDVMFSMKSAFCAKKIIASEDTVYCIIKAENTLTTKYDINYILARTEVFRRKYFFIKRNLEIKNFGFWDLSGIKIIKDALKQGYSFQFIFKIFLFFIKNKVPIISWQGMKNSILYRLLRR